jgi:hypothetical protein
MKKWYILMLLMSLWFIGAQAQETVRGVVTDAAGEPLIGANVVKKDNPVMEQLQILTANSH